MTNIYPYASRRKYSESDGINSDHTFEVRSMSIGKRSSDVSPYLLANEWISGRIAQFLQLPIPSFAIVRKRSASTKMFVSHRFEMETSRTLIDAARLYEAFPFVCAGVVVFDIFVCNGDRAIRNIKVDSNAHPKVMHIIDHERSLFYVYLNGIEHLEGMNNRLGISDSHGSQGVDHCLVALLNDYSHLRTWVQRVQDVPDWFIDAICEDVWKIQITRAEVRAVSDFLKRRRDGLWQLISNHRPRFASLIGYAEWELFV